jgi:hypothetical protein
MNEWIVARINSLKEDLSKKQEYFKCVCRCGETWIR